MNRLKEGIPLLVIVAPGVQGLANAVTRCSVRYTCVKDRQSLKRLTYVHHRLMILVNIVRWNLSILTWTTILALLLHATSDTTAIPLVNKHNWFQTSGQATGPICKKNMRPLHDGLTEASPRTQ